MLRRTFLKALGGLLLAPFIKSETKPYHHPLFGKYLGCSVRRNEDWQELKWPGENPPFFRYIQFPVEVILETRFEKMTVEWVNFNGSRDLQSRMEKMSGHELFAHADWDKGELTLLDEVSIVGELDPERAERMPGKTARFRMTAIYHPFNISESIDFMLKHCKDARWDVVAKAVETLEKGYASGC